ncbi:sodium-dependent transporter [Eggerthellaceae bacterium zg-1084]|uniref:Transporter n=1 Tax=Berryella wangjianweii TaxID=2734634 RepID=A0A6M8JAA5_9ACTN|nr:sodium-dependent transporter [Berryella wangjianweii]NPD31630.1 sodium-dependent transporter [Berryella wangjianweii]NPD32875.1 sodium-dependent transporter [Eggerthellaceae bacterium zg-997]QKF07752.1 sodium-dependent transporter [Berryella wangjianweii]
MSSTIAERSAWSGRWAFILAGAASAVGLGNMWRFPYLAAKYGGGTFILTYLVLVFTFGATLLLLETALGRKTGLSAIGAFKKFGKKFAFIGVLASAVPFIITPYYSIIGGWVTKYTAAYLLNGPAALSDGGGFFTSFITSPFESFLWMAIFMIVVFVVVGMGVEGGIEKANLFMMPALIIMAVGIAIYTLTMPGALDGVAYYLLPDPSKFSPELLIGALGQMFYSLSLAMGIMITYGSYLDRKEKLTSSVANIGMFDLGVSVLAGLMIVPAAFVAMGSGEAVAAGSGPSLMFITLPKVFESMGGAVATVLGFLFFLLVLFAALTSAISLVETCVSIIMDGAGFSRKRAFAIVIAVVVVAGVFINLGYNALSFVQPLGEGSSILDLFDFISNSVMMPIVALLTCVFVGWIIKPQTLIDEVEVAGPFKLKGAWTVMVKYIAPVLVVIILVAYVGAQFGIFKF